jgi:hypothetical protein
MSTRECNGLLEQRLPPVHVRRVENSGWQLGPGNRFTKERQSAITVADVQMYDAGFAGHQSADVRFAGNAQ